MSGAAAEARSIEPDTALSPAPGYGRNFWLLFGSTFALNFSANLFVLYPLQLVALGASAKAIGAIVGAWSLASLLVRPIAGPMIDRAGRRNTAAWLLGLDAIVLTLYLPINSLGWHIYGVRALHGAVEGTARVGLFALLYDVLPKGREGRAMATFSICGLGSGAAAPYVGEFLIKQLGFGAFFAAIIAVTAIAATLVAMIPATTAAKPHAATPTSPKGYAQLLLDRQLMPLWIVTLFFALAISSRLSFVTPFAHQQGIAQLGTYFAIYSVTGVAVRLFSGRLIDTVGLERTLAPSMLVLAVGLALIAGTGHFGLLNAAGAIGGFGHGYLYPTLSAMVIARTDIGATGRSSSIYQSLYDIGAMVGPYGLGAIANAFGYGPMFIISGALALIGAIYFLAADPELHLRRLA